MSTRSMILLSPPPSPIAKLSALFFLFASCSSLFLRSASLASYSYLSIWSCICFNLSLVFYINLGIICAFDKAILALASLFISLDSSYRWRAKTFCRSASVSQTASSKALLLAPYAAKRRASLLVYSSWRRCFSAASDLVFFISSSFYFSTLSLFILYILSAYVSITFPSYAAAALWHSLYTY